MEIASDTSSVVTAVSEDVESLREQIQNQEEVGNGLVPQINLYRLHKDIGAAGPRKSLQSVVSRREGEKKQAYATVRH